MQFFMMLVEEFKINVDLYEMKFLKVYEVIETLKALVIDKSKEKKIYSLMINNDSHNKSNTFTKMESRFRFIGYC